MAFRILKTKNEFEQFEREHPWTWEQDAIEAIHRYPEFRFTADGRFFSMVFDGEAIGHLMLANGCPDFREHQRVRSELRAIAGAIVTYDEHGYAVPDEILLYHDTQELIDAWHELHTIAGAQMSDADAERLAECDEDGDDNE